MSRKQVQRNTACVFNVKTKILISKVQKIINKDIKNPSATLITDNLWSKSQKKGVTQFCFSLKASFVALVCCSHHYSK